MATDRKQLGPETDDPEPTTEVTPGSDADDDTEGQMMIPDGTARYLARDRERNIRQHLSGRQREQQAREAQKRK